jgi:hypothetical protein
MREVAFGNFGPADERGGAFVACFGIDLCGHDDGYGSKQGPGDAPAIAFYHPVTEADDPKGVVGDIFFVGDEDDGVACGLDGW